MIEMQRKFTANGTFISQDVAGDDMCILFLKYGRCRFKTKCKKSHWVPPLPDEPYPVQRKPPLPNDSLTGKERENTFENVKDSSNNCQIFQAELQDRIPLLHQSPKSTSVKKTDSAIHPKVVKNYMLPRRFKHVFHGNCNDLSVGYSRVHKLFNDAGAYFDNVTQKLQTCQTVRNKTEKQRLKVLRRINWRNTQVLKEKLSQCPPSYNLKFDRSKINFTRLTPYVYVLVHECMFVDGEKKKTIKVPSFEYLIADTLLAYLESECITAQEAEGKLQQWGARAVRARQCIAHLWHILAISSKSPSGCANEIIAIEEEVEKGTRTSLDYACACSFALKRAQARMITNSHKPQMESSSIKQGLEAKRERGKRYVLGNTPGYLTRSAKEGNREQKRATEDLERGNETSKHAEHVNDHAESLSEHAETVNAHAGKLIEHAEKVTEHAKKSNKHAEAEMKLRVETVEHVNDRGRTRNQRTEHAQEKITHGGISIAHARIPTTHEKQHETIAQNETVGQELKHIFSNPIRKKRQRSRQFKNMRLNEREKFKTRCVQLLSTS